MPSSLAADRPQTGSAEFTQLCEFFASLPASPRVVLDSNVWIDILVFDDPHSRPIRAALEISALTALNSLPCRTELERVLAYPQFVARRIDIANALTRVDGYATSIEVSNGPCAPLALPQCSDRDDQKFLELARDGGAHWLVSKDKALLKLRQRVARDFPFRIVTSATFSRVLQATAQIRAAA